MVVLLISICIIVFSITFSSWGGVAVPFCNSMGYFRDCPLCYNIYKISGSWKINSFLHLAQVIGRPIKLPTLPKISPNDQSVGWRPCQENGTELPLPFSSLPFYALSCFWIPVCWSFGRLVHLFPTVKIYQSSRRPVNTCCNPPSPDNV